MNDRQPREVVRDLDDVRVVEIPWLARPDAPAFAKLPRPDYPSAALDRLYALGIDASASRRRFADGPPDKLELDGATGHLSLDGRGRSCAKARCCSSATASSFPLDAR